MQRSRAHQNDPRYELRAHEPPRAPARKHQWEGKLGISDAMSFKVEEKKKPKRGPSGDNRLPQTSMFFLYIYLLMLILRIG